MKLAGMAAALLGTLSSVPAFADLRDLWRSSESAGHYFLKDNASGKYVETIHCQAAYSFEVVSSDTGLRLFDASRNVYVELQNGAMWLKVGAGAWSKYKKGTFDHRVTFDHMDASGGVTGSIWKKNSCQWAEYLDGTGNAAFRFTETKADGGKIIMYDHSRGLYVLLTEGSMYLRQGEAGMFKMFKKGGWY